MTEIFTFNLSPFSIFIAAFAIFAWTRAYQRRREGTFTVGEFTFWTLVWVSAIILIFVRRPTDLLGNALGVERGSDVIFAIATVVLFYSVYRVYAKIDSFDKNLTRLIRVQAIQNAEKKSSD